MSKRILVVLLALLVLAGIMVSCKNEVQVPAEDLVGDADVFLDQFHAVNPIFRR